VDDVGRVDREHDRGEAACGAAHRHEHDPRTRDHVGGAVHGVDLRGEIAQIVGRRDDARALADDRQRIAERRGSDQGHVEEGRHPGLPGRQRAEPEGGLVEQPRDRGRRERAAGPLERRTGMPGAAHAAAVETEPCLKPERVADPADEARRRDGERLRLLGRLEGGRRCLTAGPGAGGTVAGAVARDDARGGGRRGHPAVHEHVARPVEQPARDHVAAGRGRQAKAGAERDTPDVATDDAAGRLAARDRIEEPEHDAAVRHAGQPLERGRQRDAALGFGAGLEGACERVVEADVAHPIDCGGALVHALQDIMAFVPARC
jgi:hypothetical protein